MQLTPKRLADFSTYLHAFDPEYVQSLVSIVCDLGFELNNKGQLLYSHRFKPLLLNYKLVFVRHGETYGNCGQTTVNAKVNHEWVKLNVKNHDMRVFQGCVDEDINQLTPLGLEQSKQAAIKLKEMFKDRLPDYVFHSPLKRARDTALPFVQENNLNHSFLPLKESTEISFGAWENRRICDFDVKHVCHDFYRHQNVLVKKSGINGNGNFQHAECFAEALIRARKLLMSLNTECKNSTVVLFSHSMFGAACRIVLGKGEVVETGGYLAFDGKRQDQTSYAIPNATPVPLNF